MTLKPTPVPKPDQCDQHLAPLVAVQGARHRYACGCVRQVTVHEAPNQSTPQGILPASS